MAKNIPALSTATSAMLNESVYEGLLQLQQPWRLGLEDHPQYPLYWFENHDNFYWRKFVFENPEYPYIACVVYLATIFGIQKFMKDRPPLSLRTPLVVWNWALGIFSIFGCYRMSQEIGTLVLFQENGLHKSVCETVYHYRPAAFWGFLFVVSKYVELGDTVFIALKKQRLLALQWYHHCLVTVFAWVLYAMQEPILRWYSLINYGVHAMMYPYFALRGMNVKVPEIFAMAITSIQVCQMVAGVSLNVYALIVWGQGGTCARNPLSVAFSLFTYFSLLVMFAQFFVSKYVSRTRKKTKFQ